jgi:hypothetical protein
MNVSRRAKHHCEQYFSLNAELAGLFCVRRALA